MNFLTWSGRWSSAAPAIPTIILFVALLFLPQARIEGRRITRTVSPRLPTIRRALLGFGLLLVAVASIVAVAARPDVRIVGLALVTAFIMLSLVPLIGWSGQISLAQVTFVGIGAWAAVEFARGGGQVFGLELFSPGSPWLLLAGAVVAVPVGVLMALPALRLQGLYLALATLAFARLAEFVIFDQPEVFGGAGRRIGNLEVFGATPAKPFTILGIHFPEDAGFVLFVAAMFCVFGFAIVLTRRGAFGRRLVAMKDSPAACATLGVNLTSTKVAVFALSAAIAGFGGAMLGMLRGSASTANFQVLQGLPYVILIVVAGASVVSGALLGAVLFQLPVFLLDRLGAWEVRLPIVSTFKPFVIWNRLSTGFLGIALGRRPDGIVPGVSSELEERRRPRSPSVPVNEARSLPARSTAALPRELGEVVLTVDDVVVRFGGLCALDGVSFAVRERGITGLIGPNGAGKTTLFNVITGLQVPTSGAVRISDEDITNAKPHTRARMGIGRTFQRLETFGTLTVRENVLVGAEMRRRWSRDTFDANVLTTELIERVGLQSVADEKVDTLATGTARLVEVARALAGNPKVLLLDEPSAGLNEHETRALGSLLGDLTREGLAVLLVEHDMSLVMAACDHIHVLDFGSLIAEGSPADVQANPEVQVAYLGSDEQGRARHGGLVEVAAREAGAEADLPVTTDADASRRRERTGGHGDALVLRDVRAAYGLIDVLHGIDLTIPTGSVFALLGPNGAGKSTTLRVASGLLKPTGGAVEALGVDVTGDSADRIARRGVCLVPEGRGVFPNLTVLENLRMATYSGTDFATVAERAFQRFPRLRDRRKQVAGTLSGGEQQMLAMARALATEPRLLLLDELSMGLAPLIVEELYEVVARIAADDVSILVVEQFAHEALGIADVAAVMLHGRIEHTGAPRDIGDALSRTYLGESVAPR